MADIYLLTFPNGKQYVGKTVRSMDFRFNQHARNAVNGVDFTVYRAWRKYGPPTLSLLCRCVDDLASSLEIFWINHLKTVTPSGYNGTLGGTGGVLSPAALEKARRTRSTPEFRTKMSVAQRDPLIQERRRSAMKAVRSQPEDIARLREVAKTLWQTPEYVEKTRLANTSEEVKAKRRATVSSPEYKEKVSKIFTALRSTPEYRERQSKKLKEVNGTAEARQAIAERARSRWANPEFKAKRLADMRSPEYKERRKAMLDAKKAQHT